MPVTLVTGASGFTGRYLVAALAKAGHEVHALNHRAEDDRIAGIHHTHLADLQDLRALRDVFKNIQPDNVVHLAAIAFVAHGDIEELYRTNIIGTRNLLQALSEVDRTPPVILLASSANIYGNREGLIREDARPMPANDYGVTKAAVEYIAGIFSEQLPIIVVRPFNYTGPGQPINFIIPKIIDHVKRRAPEIELGNIDVARDFSDVRTVTDAYVRLLSNHEAIGKTFNISSGKATTLREVLDIARTISGHDFTVKINPDFVRQNEVKTLCGDHSYLESVIGPLKEYPLEETIARMLEA